MQTVGFVQAEFEQLGIRAKALRKTTPERSRATGIEQRRQSKHMFGQREHELSPNGCEPQTPKALTTSHQPRKESTTTTKKTKTKP